MKKLSSKGKKILAACILVFLAAAVTLVSTLAVQHANGPAKVVKTYFTSMNERNFDDFCDCLMPEQQKLIEMRMKQLGGAEAYFDQVLYDSFKSNELSSQFGTDIEFQVSDLKAESQTYEGDVFNGIDMKGLNATAASIVECSITTKGTAGEVTNPTRVICLKISGKWYIYAMSEITETYETPTDVN